MKKNGLFFILLLLILLFAASVLKNIQYPLLWNDESETPMFAERILQYGYPKIHDGKNSVYFFNSPAAINDKFDACLFPGWAQYYFCAPGAYLARQAHNIYFKTALLRIPFALIGIFGILFFGYTFTLFFKDMRGKLLFMSSFVFLELLTVPLIHHLREARYYSILIFFSACYFHVCVKRVFLNNLSGRRFLTYLVILNVLLFNTYYPAVFIFSASFFIHQLYLLMTKNINFKGFIKGISPLIVSFFLIIPQMYFFRTFEIMNSLNGYAVFSLTLYFEHIRQIMTFFINNNFLFLILFVNIFLVVFLFYNKRNNLPSFPKDNLNISCLLKLFVFLYILIIAKTPFLFERYFIVLQPILAAVLVLDTFLFFELMNNIYLPLNMRKIVVLLMVLIPLITFSYNFSPLREHFYELFHQYKGPLDFVIPYIIQNYKNPDNLIIATNYEETSYMYYLGAKTVIGYAHFNLTDDLKETPDIIIFRKYWLLDSEKSMLNSFLNKAKYERKSFPVFDYPYNNIPESSLHLYRTKPAQNKFEAVEIFIRK